MNSQSCHNLRQKMHARQNLLGATGNMVSTFNESDTGPFRLRPWNVFVTSYHCTKAHSVDVLRM